MHPDVTVFLLILSPLIPLSYWTMLACVSRHWEKKTISQYQVEFGKSKWKTQKTVSIILDIVIFYSSIIYLTATSSFIQKYIDPAIGFYFSVPVLLFIISSTIPFSNKSKDINTSLVSIAFPLFYLGIAFWVPLAAIAYYF